VVLIRRLNVLGAALGVVLCLVLSGGCGQSLFDAHGDVVNDGAVAPATCQAPCVADAAKDFNGTPGGAGSHWRYLDDHRDRTWTPMAPAAGDAMAMAGADPSNHITTCAAHASAPACKTLPGALLVSSAGATSAADPAIEITAPASQVIQLSLRAFVPGGDDQTIRIYRNSREDVLFTGTAAAGTALDHAITLDALAGDRFLVALAPTARGATDVGLHVFVSATGASFPSTCQVAVPFAAAAGNTVDNLCGGDFTHGLYSGGDTPPPLATAPFPELGKAGDFTPDAYFQGTGTLDKAHDVTVQFWVKLRGFVDPYDGWLFSDLDLDATGGLGVAIVNTTPPKLYVETCTSTTPTITFANAVAPYPTDGSWQFVRVVHTNGNVYVCLNGARKTSFTVAPGRLQSTFSPYLGKNVVWTPAGAFFNGEIDDVRVLTGALPCD
jgi:hypothetical protein